ncbi:aminoglycoside phosphotransferase family protein [Kribbella sp. NBC_00359]|uniref:aminoglycoside phosphotransferase family protein n=1 Tax=Kribbella sp. NBC_00359 TaxID=2975966 RepID=UPI002E22CDB9
MTPKTNPDEIDISEALVSELITSQFPDWAHLPLAKVSSAGTDNAIYRLGDAMAVRLPRLSRAAETVAKEQRWLPRLAPQLPLSIPVPLAVGIPGGEFPYPWSVYRWLPGEDLAARTDVDICDVGGRLGAFIAALQRIDTAAGPVSPRATPVDAREDDVVRVTIRQLSEEGSLDGDAAVAVWESALAAPSWKRRPVWIHGDLFPSNLLAVLGRLAAVIDFGLLGLGDPATDMLPAWTLLTARSREFFRAAAEVDDATWVRGRGWALSAGLGAVRVYRRTNPVLAAAGRHAIDQAVADHLNST